MTRGRKSACSGFTLLEVLVALIIIGISLGTVFQALSHSKRIAWRSSEALEAVRIFNTLLVDSALIADALREKAAEGEVKDESGWRYEIAVVPLEIETENEDDDETLEIPGMYELELSLTHQSFLREKAFRISRWYRQ